MTIEEVKQVEEEGLEGIDMPERTNRVLYGLLSDNLRWEASTRVSKGKMIKGSPEDDAKIKELVEKGEYLSDIEKTAILSAEYGAMEYDNPIYKDVDGNEVDNEEDAEDVDEWYGWEVLVRVPNLPEDTSRDILEQIMRFYSDFYTEKHFKKNGYKIRQNDTERYAFKDGRWEISFALQGEGR